MANVFIITPGELDSVGLEVTLKALDQIKITDVYVFYTNDELLKKHLDFISINFNLQEIKDIDDSLKPGVYYINSKEEPVDWFKSACNFCSEKPNRRALITGPLTKSSFNDSKALGHTEYLRSLYPGTDLFMTFFGAHYNCLLLNDHIPLSTVSSKISLKLIKKASNLILESFGNKNIGLLGLNPHAGEGGLIGSEEDLMHKIACEENECLKGPLSPDGFFSAKDYEEYDFIIANYHDQGLIPFKLINGFNASQASLGLPFVRTSVDHGTSTNLFMKNKANPGSMVHALKLAHKLLTLKSKN